MTATETKPAAKSRPTCNRVGVLYIPAKQRIGKGRYTGVLRAVGGGESKPIRTYAIEIMIPYSQPLQQQQNGLPTRYRPKAIEIEFKPGANLDINKLEWDAAKEQPHVQKALKEGWLVELTVKQSWAKDEAKTILAYDNDSALLIATETYDMQLLEFWMANEKRQEVFDALKAQLEELKAEAEEEAM